MISRPDMLDERSPRGIEVVQLTNDPAVPACHIYMEAQVFTPDARRFVLHRSAHAHGSDQHDPHHQYLLCDLDNDGALSPLTTETGATAPSVTPDGTAMYYFVNETQVHGGRLTLKRVNLDGTGRDTVLVVDAPVQDTSYRPSRIYPLSTLSSDGTRLALSCFLGDGRTAEAPFGLLVFDLQQATVHVAIAGPTWCNMHPQYCRSYHPEHRRDILIQENHGCMADAQGVTTVGVSGLGVDIHVIRDDGRDFRDMPWGRDGNEFNQGHQCWIGRSAWGLTGTGCTVPAERQLIAGRAAPHADHIGLASPGGVRVDMSRSFDTPQFCHFATDIAGTRLITDHYLCDEVWELYSAPLPDPARHEPIPAFTYLLRPRNSLGSPTHSHPFLSPDGALGFFNSDESGLMQAYMIRGLDTL